MNKPSLLDGQYDFWHGDENLINPAPSPLDDKIIALCLRFSESDKSGRKSITESLDGKNFDTLMTFALRCSVFAMRDRNCQYLWDALTAISMIDEKRSDYRDIHMTLSPVYHAAKVIHEDSMRFMLKVRALIPSVFNAQDPQVSEEMLRKSLKLEGWGFEEAHTKYGVGFIHHEYEDYQPSCDLVAAVVEIGDLFTVGGYQLSSIEKGTELAPVWLKSANDPKLDEVLDTSRAAVRIWARLRPDMSSGSDKQRLMSVLMELGDEGSARKLQEICNKVDADYALIGISLGRLVCIVIQSAWYLGVAAHETNESLSRFKEGITRILEQFTAQS